MSDPTKFSEAKGYTFGTTLTEFACISSEIPASAFTFTGGQGKAIVTISRDGKVTLGEGASNDEASKAFWKSVCELGISNLTQEHRVALRRVVGAIRSLPPGGELRRRLVEYEFGYNHRLFFKDLEALEKLL